LTDAMPDNKPKDGGLRPLYFYLIVALVFIGDQLSKAWVQNTMRFGDYRSVFGHAFMLTLTKNPGGAWGILPTSNTSFIAFAAVAIVALLFAYHRLARTDLLVSAAFALALGGAVGNLVDRLRFGYVVDFFDARIINWPIFNIADSAISLGIVLLLWHYLRSLRAETSPTAEPSAPPSVSLATEDLGNNTRE
jgi:signal peptidase II